MDACCVHGRCQRRGVWGTRTATPDSLQNIKYGSRRHAFDDRCEIDHAKDAIYTKRMPSPFFETPLQSLLVWHKVDTVVITGGSTSGCIRAAAVDSLSRGYRTIVPIETCAGKDERALIAQSLDTLERASGIRPRGWHSIARSQSWNTVQLLKEAGVKYCCDWRNDEMP